MTQKWPSVYHRTTLSGCMFAAKARIDNRKKLVKQQYVLQMSSQYGELRPTDFGTNRKLTYNFQLVINSNLPPILHRFRDMSFDRSKIAIFGYPYCV